MKRLLFSALVVALLLPSPALAHGGATDSNGGHMDHSTGEYHYHHGYEAHQHTDGVCPYDFDDQTDHSSGSSSDSADSSSNESSTKPISSSDSVQSSDEGSNLFSNFKHNQVTDTWMSNEGETYESTRQLLECYGFGYDAGNDTWFNSDGYLDENLCLQSFSEDGFFLCPECHNLAFGSNESDHMSWCKYLTSEEEVLQMLDDFYGNPSAVASNEETQIIVGIIGCVLGISICLIIFLLRRVWGKRKG